MSSTIWSKLNAFVKSNTHLHAVKILYGNRREWLLLFSCSSVLWWWWSWYIVCRAIECVCFGIVAICVTIGVRYSSDRWWQWWWSWRFRTSRLIRGQLNFHIVFCVCRPVNIFQTIYFSIKNVHYFCNFTNNCILFSFFNSIYTDFD